MAIRPHAELTMLEAKKYEKAAWSQDSQAESLVSDINDVRGVADSLVIDIQGEFFWTYFLTQVLRIRLNTYLYLFLYRNNTPLETLWRQHPASCEY